MPTVSIEPASGCVENSRHPIFLWNVSDLAELTHVVGALVKSPSHAEAVHLVRNRYALRSIASEMQTQLSLLLSTTLVACNPGNSQPLADGSPDGHDLVDVARDAAPININAMDLFYTSTAAGTMSLHGYDFETATDTILTNAGSFTWSPDRKTMLIASGSGSLSVFKLSDRSSIDLALDAGYATWSPDSQHILIHTASSWIVIDLDGSKHVVADPAGGAANSSFVEFTAANHLHVQGNTDWICAADGTLCTMVPAGCILAPNDTTEACSVDPRGVAFKHSPDGASLGSWVGGSRAGAWSNDSARFVGVGVGTVTNTYDVWGGKPSVGTKLRTLAAGSTGGAYVAWSPDNLHATVLEPNASVTLTIESFNSVIPMSYTLDSNARLMWSSGSQWLLVATSGVPSLISMTDLQQRSLGGLDAAMVLFAHPFSPNGDRLVYQTQHQTFFCATATATCLGLGTGQANQVYDLQWRADGTAVADVGGYLHVLSIDGAIGPKLLPLAVNEFQLR